MLSLSVARVRRPRRQTCTLLLDVCLMSGFGGREIDFRCIVAEETPRPEVIPALSPTLL